MSDSDKEVRMRLPEDANRWKSDGRIINLDLNDPSMAQSDKPGDKPTSLRFAEWLRSNGWTVSTEYGGPLRIGGQTSGKDGSVAELQELLLDEFLHSDCVY